MPNSEHITDQKELLATYRRTLTFALKQLATVGGEPYAQPSLLSTIKEARQNIRQIKTWLRRQGETVEDLPIDDPVFQEAPTIPANTVFQSKFQPVWGMLVTLIALISLVAVIYMFLTNMDRQPVTQPVSAVQPEKTAPSSLSTVVVQPTLTENSNLLAPSNPAMSSTETLPTPTSFASLFCREGKVRVQNLQVRAGPERVQSVVGILSEGTEVSLACDNIVIRGSGLAWVQARAISQDGKEVIGWVPELDISLSYCTKGKVKVQNLIGRKAPGESQEKLGDIPKDTEVDIVCKSEVLAEKLYWVQVLAKLPDGQSLVSWVPTQDIN